MHDPAAIRCLVVDDEPPARDVLCRYINDVPLLHLAGECGNAIEAMSFLKQHPVDLLFLDIHMPQLAGTDLLKILGHPPRVILTTAHPEYALQGYELDVMDYLLKPIQFERFLKAVHKATQLPGLNTEAPAAQTVKQEPFVYFRSERKMVKVMLKDILYIESMKDYVKIFTSGDGVVITKQSMTSVEAMLPEEMFARVHRSFIVSVPKIRSYTAELIELGKAEIPIGKLFRHTVLKRLG